MSEKKRMAGRYKIIYAVHIGDREIVVGEDSAATDGQKYMCAYCQQNEIIAQYDEVLASDDFPEIVVIFGQRIAEQAEKTRVDLLTPKLQGISNAPLTAQNCTPVSSDEYLNGKIVVIKPEVLRQEYRRATNQIKLCIGGFGASPHSRGSACFCVDLYSGKTSRYERGDVLGTMSTEQLPKWAEWGLQKYQQKQKQDKEAR